MTLTHFAGGRQSLPWSRGGLSTTTSPVITDASGRDIRGVLLPHDRRGFIGAGRPLQITNTQFRVRQVDVGVVIRFRLSVRAGT